VKLGYNEGYLQKYSIVYGVIMKQTNITIVQNCGTYSEIDISGISGIYVDNDDIERIMKYRWYLDAKKAKVDGLYYFKANFEIISKKPYRYKMLSLHRLIMNQIEFDGVHVVDHIDQNSKNNRKENLRICTASENLHNCRKDIDRPKFLPYDVTEEYFNSRLYIASSAFIGNLLVTKLTHNDCTYIIQSVKFKGMSTRNKLGYPGIGYNAERNKFEVFHKGVRCGLYNSIEDALLKAYSKHKIPYEIYKL